MKPNIFECLYGSIHNHCATIVTKPDKLVTNQKQLHKLVQPINYYTSCDPTLHISTLSISVQVITSPPPKVGGSL